MLRRIQSLSNTVHSALSTLDNQAASEIHPSRAQLQQYLFLPYLLPPTQLTTSLSTVNNPPSPPLEEENLLDDFL